MKKGYKEIWAMPKVEIRHLQGAMQWEGMFPCNARMCSPTKKIILRTNQARVT